VSVAAFDSIVSWAYVRLTPAISFAAFAAGAFYFEAFGRISAFSSNMISLQSLLFNERNHFNKHEIRSGLNTPVCDGFGATGCMITMMASITIVASGMN
jgi:hypothetical protein